MDDIAEAHSKASPIYAAATTQTLRTHVPCSGQAGAVGDHDDDATFRTFGSDTLIAHLNRQANMLRRLLRQREKWQEGSVPGHKRVEQQLDIWNDNLERIVNQEVAKVAKRRTRRAKKIKGSREHHSTPIQDHDHMDTESKANLDSTEPSKAAVSANQGLRKPSNLRRLNRRVCSSSMPSDERSFENLVDSASWSYALKREACRDKDEIERMVRSLVIDEARHESASLSS